VNAKRLACLFVIVTVVAACSANPANQVKASPTIPSPLVSLASSNLAPCANGAANEYIHAESVHMVNATTGWASAECTLPAGTEIPRCQWPISVVGIVRTTDGGRHWTDVSPPSVTNRTWPHAETFLDATHAWVAEVTYGQASCVDQLTTFSTSDGGKTWQRGGTIALNAGPTDAVFNIAATGAHWLDFVDWQNGWLLVPWWPNTLMDQPVQQAALYTTTDGGNTWTFLARNPGQAEETHARGCGSGVYGTIDMTWASTTDGWIETDCPATTLVHSTDSGRHWTVAPLPNCVCEVFWMSFVDAEHGFLTGRSDVMLTTRDGGGTWEQRTVPRGTYVVDFTDDLHGHALALEQGVTTYDIRLFDTGDGGSSWSPGGIVPILIVVTTQASGATSIVPPALFVHFVDAKAGYVAAIAGNLAQSSATTADLILDATTDGGLTWKTVLTQYSSAQCDSYVPPGSTPIPVLMEPGGTGWAKGGLRTTDGGATWRDVSPSALRENIKTAYYPSGYTDSYFNGDHAWQAGVYSSQNSCADHVTTFGTADGGRTWTHSAAIPLQVPAGHRFAGLELDFISADTGWLWLPYPKQGGGFAPAVDQGTLYGTSDGGAHWQHVTDLSLPSIDTGPCVATGTILFGSATAGWLPVTCGGNAALLATADGGVTWHVQKLPFAILSPKFFDGSHGVALVDGPDNAGLAITSDGGTSWQTVPLPVTGCTQLVTCNGNTPTLDFASMTDFWDFVAVLPSKGQAGTTPQVGSVFHSSDGGRTWKLIQANIRFGTTNGSPPDIIVFVMAADGHGLIGALDSTATGANYELFGTADDGHTWRAITPQIEWAS
jgi:photosystem II stability/assembly factor-like uncharacterized protein